MVTVEMDCCENFKFVYKEWNSLLSIFFAVTVQIYMKDWRVVPRKDTSMFFVIRILSLVWLTVLNRNWQAVEERGTPEP